ncbi:MAG TPA: M23 family metallopeptidase [Chloroflexi bacterium]|nr:M23 family metallopeptidase [Chloroflexota bacterium]
MILESRPPVVVAAQYTEMPFPILQPMQEVAFDLGVTATDRPLELRGVVFQGYHDHQLIFEQQWPARIIAQRLGSSDLSIAPGAGIALRGLHFMAPAYETLTHIDVTVIARAAGRATDAQHSLQIPVRFHEQKTDLHFPLRGAWWAIQGADWSDRHKQEVFSQAYATDFVRLGPDNRFFQGDGMKLEDHYSWGQPVYATAGGKVAAVIYDMPDLAPGAAPDPRLFRGDPRRLLGNAVAISHGNGEFSYYGALQQASLAVNEGQIIRRGALIGRVGNSGMSPGPHLHFHLAEGPNPFIDQGLPMRFSHFEAGGQWFEQPMTIPTRMIVIAPDAEE